MVGNFNHQKTIGIVGATPDAYDFILNANQLGFTTYLLAYKSTKGLAHYGADRYFIGTLNDEEIIEEFLMHCDLLVYFDYSISAQQLEESQKTVIIPQGEELLAISRDRVLQKAFKESLGLHIAPYATIVKPDDIKNEIKSIGYPAVLKPNYLNHEEKQEPFFIYDEQDIKEAAEIVKYGTFVLESWITPTARYSISLVKNKTGQVQLFPIVKKSFKSDQIQMIQSSVDIDEELENEMNRVALLIADNIDFCGVITIDFLISPANTLYIGSMHPFPNTLSRYSHHHSLSIVQAHLRAIGSITLPEIKNDTQAIIYVPFRFKHVDIINELITIYPAWNFSFYPQVKEDITDKEKIAGHMIIEATQKRKILDVLKEYNF